MLDSLKNKIAGIVIKRKYMKKDPVVKSFNNFFTNSAFYFVVMPVEDKEFNYALSVVKFLIEKGKSITVFIPEVKMSFMPASSKLKYLTFTQEEVSKLNLPKNPLVRMLRKKSFDVVIDLNTGKNIFASAISNIVEANYRVGFIKENSDIYYNLHLPNDKNNSEISYKNLLNSLGMF